MLWNYESLQSVEADTWTDAKCKVGLFVTIVNDWKPLTIVTKNSILDFAPIQDPPLGLLENSLTFLMKTENLCIFAQNLFSEKNNCIAFTSLLRRASNSK